MQQADWIKIDKLTNWVKQVPWKLFCTLTFGRRVSDTQAEKIFHAFINCLQRHLRSEVCFVRGDEKRFAGCGLPASGRHFHVLMACIGPVQPKLIETLWTRMAGNRANGAGAQVEEYNPNEDGVRYVLKHIYQPDGNWDFKNLEMFHPEARNAQKMNKRWRRRLKRFNARQEKFASARTEEEKREER